MVLAACIAAPDSVQPGHYHCHDPGTDVCSGTAIFGKGSFQVLKAVHLLQLYSFHVGICIVVGVNDDIPFVSVGLHFIFVCTVLIWGKGDPKPFIISR